MAAVVSAIGTALGIGGSTGFASPATVPAFTIRQLTGPLRRVDLTGRGLPYRPFQLTTRQRVELVWLPGYTEATATVLGGVEEPTTINGYWKDKFVAPDTVLPDQQGGIEGLVSSVASAVGVTSPPSPQAQQAPISVGGGPANSVRQVADEVDSIVREGQLVEVIWWDDVRHGFLVEFDKRWHNVHDLEWSMKFEWTSRGDPQPAATLGPPDVSSQASSIGQLAANLLSAAQDPKFTLVPADVQAIQAALQKISADADGITSLSEALVNAAISPVSTIQQAVALAAGMVGDVDSFEDFIQARVAPEFNAGALLPPGFTSGGTSTGYVGGTASGGSNIGQVQQASTPAGGLPPGAGVGGSSGALGSRAASLAAVAALGFGTPPPVGERSFTEVLAAQLYVRSMLASSRPLRRAAVEFRENLVDQNRNVLLGVYTARDGDELRKVSRIYYGTKDHWQDLMIFNALTSSALARGQVVLVPKVADVVRGGL